MNEEYIFEKEVECWECKGTGLYSGMAERNGAAVICRRCKGEGKRKVHHEYTPFTGKKVKEGIKRVYKNGAGYCISSEDVTTDDGRVIEFSKAGVSYGEWLNGESPPPIKDLQCPLMFFEQGTPQGEYLKNEGTCSDKLTIGDSISVCCNINRERCWEWVEEHNKEIPK